MFITNLNIFIAVVAGMSYLLGWLLGVPPSMVRLPYGESLVIALLFVATVLLSIWSKWGLVLPAARVKRTWLYFAGNIGIAASSLIFVGGIAMSFQAGSISREEEFWCWIFMLYYIGPLGAAFLGISMAFIFRAQIVRLFSFKQS